MVILNDEVFLDVRLRIGERLEQHYENLRLWESGYLDPTEPSEDERVIVMLELRACIAELEPLARMCGILPPEDDRCRL